MSFGDDRYSEDVGPGDARPMLNVAEAAAEHLRRASGRIALPVPVEELIADSGLMILEISDPKQPDGSLLAAQSLIIVNRSRHRPTRERFTLAHELGHFQLKHHQRDASEALLDALTDPVIDDSQAYLSRRHPRIEQEANAFAAALLMPASALRAEFARRDWDPTRVAKQLIVSEEALWWRLLRLRLI